MEVFIQRLEDEYDADTIVTSPSVMYKGRTSFVHLKYRSSPFFFFYILPVIDSFYKMFQ